MARVFFVTGSAGGIGCETLQDRRALRKSTRGSQIVLISSLMKAATMSPPSDRLHNVFLANRLDAIPDENNITVQCILEQSQTTASIFLLTEAMTTFERPVNPARFAEMWGYCSQHNRMLFGSILGVLVDEQDGVSQKGANSEVSSTSNWGGVH